MYIKRARKTGNKEIALHLLDIIPKTCHLNDAIFNSIQNEIKDKIDAGRSFQVAFDRVSRKYVLQGHLITAKLPAVLIRIIANKEKFLEKVSNKINIPIDELKNQMAVMGIKDFAPRLGKLSEGGKMVFATFDDTNMEKDPFENSKADEIISRAALDMNSFDEGEPITVVKIRYRNLAHIDKKFPSFADAGWRKTFFPANKNDKYGRTRSLNSKWDGVAEVVHKDVKMSEVIEDGAFIGS